jgi:hypothetical protein
MCRKSRRLRSKGGRHVHDVASLFWSARSAFALTSVVLMSSAYAQVQPPEPPHQAPPGGAAGLSMATEVRWMLIGAGLLLAVAAVAWLIAAGYRRYRHVARPQMPNRRAVSNQLRCPAMIRLVAAALSGAMVPTAVVLMASTAGATVGRPSSPAPPPEPVPLTHTDGSRVHWLMLGSLLGLAVLLLVVAISVAVHGWRNRSPSERHPGRTAGWPGAEIGDVGRREDPWP